jgi:hypothetical protein
MFDPFLDRRHIDVRLLPSLVPKVFQNDTAQIIEPQLTARITRLKSMIDAGVIDQDTQSDGSSTIYLSLASKQDG